MNIEKGSEYNLASLEATIGGDVLERFVGLRWPARLGDIPKIGPKSVETLATHNIHSTTAFVAGFLQRACDPTMCLEYCHSVLPASANHHTICLLILYKLQVEFEIVAPIGWETVLCPKKK